METKTHLGHNRTGVQMSPIDASEMQEGVELFQPDGTAARQDPDVRLEFADGTDSLGSVPLPGTMSGMMHSGLDMVTGKRPQVLIDKLGERLAFERSGVRLYEGLLLKCRASPDVLPDVDHQALQRFRDEEAEHFALVAQSLEDLGADSTAQTPCADLVGMEGMGLVQAVNDPRTSLVQALHVMLDAELIDNAAWEMLIELAEAAGHEELAGQLQPAADQEARHLSLLRELVLRLTLQDASAVAAPDQSA